MDQYVQFKADIFFPLLTLIVCGKGVVLDCYRTSIYEYDGHQQTTYTGSPCKRWDSVEHNFKDFPDASMSDAGNFCRNPDRSDNIWCITSSDWDVCGIKKCDNNSITQCGKVTVKQPSNFEDNLKFTFIPDENDPNAIVEWQQSTLKDKKWTTLPLKSNFFQHFKGGAYTLVLTNSTYQISRHVSYRVHYYNETVHCLMETPNIIFQENEHSGKNSEENVDLSFIWVILLISAVTFVVVTIVFFIRRFRRRKDKVKRDKNNGRTKEGANEERVNGVKVVEEAYEILNDSTPRQMDEQYIQLPSGSYKQ